MLSVYLGNKLIIGRAGKADNFFSRFMGLMFKKGMDSDQGLLITPCNQVHTFNMRFDIDVVFLDKKDEVVHIEHSMKRGKVSKIIKNAHSVLELCSGTAKNCGINIGDKLTFKE